MTDILVVRLIGGGGDDPCIGLKNACAMFNPSGPKVDDDAVFCIFLVLFVLRNCFVCESDVVFVEC